MNSYRIRPTRWLAGDPVSLDQVEAISLQRAVDGGNQGERFRLIRHYQRMHYRFQKSQELVIRSLRPSQPKRMWVAISAVAELNRRSSDGISSRGQTRFRKARAGLCGTLSKTQESP